MTKQEMNKVFNGFFGESIAKADAIIAEAKVKKETKKERKVNVNYKEVYNNFFGDVMKRTSQF